MNLYIFLILLSTILLMKCKGQENYLDDRSENNGEIIFEEHIIDVGHDF